MLPKLYYNNVDLIRASLHEALNKKYSLYLQFTMFLKTLIPIYVRKILIDYLEYELQAMFRKLMLCFQIIISHTWLLFNSLSDIVCIDFLGRKIRFEIIYLLLSVQYNNRVRIKIYSNDFYLIPTLTPILPAAGWFEREIWDLFGVFFFENKDLRRLLNDYGFKGHPLRKDFPLSGFFEVLYNDTVKRIVYEDISLAQTYRSFVFSYIW